MRFRRFVTGMGITLFLSVVVGGGFALAGWADPQGWAAWRVGLIPASFSLMAGTIGTLIWMTDDTGSL